MEKHLQGCKNVDDEARHQIQLYVNCKDPMSSMPQNPQILTRDFNKMRGKELSWIWQYFDRYEENLNEKNVFVGYCKFCQTRYVSNPGRMEKHIQGCKNVDDETRHQIQYFLNTKSQKAPILTNRPNCSDEKRAISKPKLMPSKNLIFESFAVDKQKLDVLLTRAFVTGNISTKFLENPFFIEFLNKLCPAYKLPSRYHSFSRHLVPSEFKRVKEMVDYAVNGADFISLSSDGWTDSIKNTKINVVTYTPRPFLTNSIDSPGTAHTAIYIAGILSEEIEKAGPQKVVALVTDYSINMKSAWTIINQKFPWIICGLSGSGCKAHALNLLALDIAGIPFVKKTLDDSLAIAKFFRRTKPCLALSAFQLKSFSHSNKLPLPVKARWQSQAEMVNAIFKSKEAIEETICKVEIRSLPEWDTIKKIVEDQNYWTLLVDIRMLLDPILGAIKEIENDTINNEGSLAVIRKCFDLVNAAIIESSFSSEDQDLFLEKLEARREFSKTEVGFLIELLDPLDRGQNLSNEERERAINLVNNKLLKNPLFVGKESEVITELGFWIAETGPFSRDKMDFAWQVAGKQDYYTWWKAWFGKTWLSRIVRAISIIPLKFAFCERNLSLRNVTTSKKGDRLLVKTPSMQTYLKHNLMFEFNSQFKPFDVSQSESLPETMPESKLEMHDLDDLEYYDSNSSFSDEILTADEYDNEDICDDINETIDDDLSSMIFD